MSRVFTILLCVLALGVVIFLAIYEPLTQGTREQAAAMRDGLVLSLNPADVKEIRLSSPTGELELKRRGNGWQVGPKPKDRANPALVEKLLHTVADLQYFDRISGSEFKKDDDWNDYGLRNAKRKIEFRGKDDVTLYLGKDGANEDRLYVRQSESRDVFLVSDEILNIGFPEVSKFRDERLTDLGADQIDRFILRRPEGEIELVHGASGWRMLKPLDAPANEKAVNDFLNHLLSFRIKEIVADDSGDLSSYGIAEGNNEITFYAEGKVRPQTLRLGTEKNGTIFAQFTARDSVYRLPLEVADLLKATPDMLRDRRLLPLNLDLVDLIRFRTPDHQFSLRRDGDGWVLQDGQETRPVNPAAVQALANALANAQVQSYVPAIGNNLAEHGFTPPVGVIEFVSVLTENTPEVPAGDRVIASVTFGKPGNGQTFVRLNDTPEIEVVPDSLQSAVSFDPVTWAPPK